MTTINPYIDFNGNAEEAFNFYKSVFGGEFMRVMRWKDMPAGPSEGCPGGEAAEGAEGAEGTEGAPQFQLSEADGEKIMHISLPIGNGNVLMASDSIEGMGPKRIEGNNFSITLGPESREETERLYNALAEGGTAAMPLADAFWGATFGMCTDKFGVQWLFNYEHENNEQ